MDKEQLKQIIDLHKNMLTHIWTLALVTIAGTLSLLQNLNNPINIILLPTGFLIFVILLYFYMSKVIMLNKLIGKLKDN